jgi:hypothetical protein
MANQSNRPAASSASTPGDGGSLAVPKHDEQDELERLRRENAELRAKLAEAGVPADPEKPHRPSFGISEGTREELERTGKAVDPFTGEKLTKDDLK